MCLTEYDEEEFKRVCREDGYADGLAEGRSEKAVETATNALKMGLSAEKTSKITGLPIEEVLKLKELIVTKA